MGLNKGKTNNPNGRPKGVPNKVTTDLRTGIDAFLKSKWTEVYEIWEELDAKDKIIFFDKMMKYVVPQLQSTTIDAKIETRSKLSTLNDQQLNLLIDQIITEDDGTDLQEY